jgi:hypothetical protein
MFMIKSLAALAAVAAPYLVQGAPVPNDEIVAGKWIVQLRPDVDVATITSHIATVKAIHARNMLARRDLTEAQTGGVENEYGFGTFHGYSGGFDDATIEELKSMPEVSYYCVLCEKLSCSLDTPGPKCRA